MRLRRSVRIILAGLGVGLFAFLVWRVGPWRLAENIHELGWGLLAIFGLGGVSHVVKTWAWRFTFARQHRMIPFLRMLSIRLAGEAVSQLSFAGQVFGETTRALMMRSAVPMVSGVSSVVLDRGMYTFTGLLLIVLGALLSLVALQLSETVQVYDTVVAVGLVGFALLVVVAVRQRWPVLSAAVHALGRVGVMKPWAESKRASVREIETIIHSFYQQRRRDFWCSFGLNLLGHAHSVMEVYLVLWFLGAEPAVLAAFFIEVLTKLVNIAGAVIPGNYGAYEGGNMIILHALGLGAATGLTLGITRRIRGLAWASVGLTVLLVHGLRQKRVATVAEISINRHEPNPLVLE
ncbi:MAG: flippase-like domain-containing protein [Acidobacteria bacterium]|nr:flippase-like domain-containing protein [Acidobacteriota bacterium]